MRSWLPLNICLFGAVVATGCRWSQQSYPSAHEGEVRFEHCYRLDEEGTESQEVRCRCWREWIHVHTYGQSRDRIDYATRRESALAQAQANGENAPPASATVDPARAGAVSSPVPTSAFASPPRTVSQDAGTFAPTSTVLALAASNDAPRRPVPGAVCAGSCAAKWLDCGQACKAAGCQSSCDSRYRSCMRACF